MRVVAFVPIKLNSERLPGKNVKSFDNGRPLITYILNALLSSDGLTEVYVYCSDESIRNYLPPHIHFLQRPTELDLPSTSISQVMTSFANAVVADIYVLAHATSPFISSEAIQLAVAKVRTGEFDSALSVRPLREFLWQNGRALNYDPSSIPRTQDLDVVHAETTGLYVYPRELLLRRKRRVGDHPYFVEVSPIEGIDINYPIDFAIANAIFNFLFFRSDSASLHPGTDAV